MQLCQRWELPGFDYPGGDALSAEALEDLAFAPTVLTAEILLDQVHGALRAEIARLAVLVLQEPAVARARLDAIIARGVYGLRLVSGWKVVIAGRPNVGKSRMLNALCGFPRAIVDGAPGTTRDVVVFQTALGGWPTLLADTAGLRGTDDAIENLGIERAQRELEAADLVLLVLDRSESLRSIDRQLIATISDALVVANKSDLEPAWRDGETGLVEATVVTVSAERGDGIGLARRIDDRAIGSGGTGAWRSYSLPQQTRGKTGQGARRPGGREPGPGGRRARNPDPRRRQRLTAGIGRV